MRFETRDDVLTYKGQQKTIETLGWWCTNCNEAIFDGKALASRDKAFLELKAEVDAVLGPSAVARIREKLKLSQRRAGELLGGGLRAFQKYESGKQAVSTPMSLLLKLLDKDPSRLKEIATAAPKAARKKARPGLSSDPASRKAPLAAARKRRQAESTKRKKAEAEGKAPKRASRLSAEA